MAGGGGVRWPPAGDVRAMVAGGGPARFWTSPDLSVSVTEREALDAVHLFDFINWDLVESAIDPPGAKDAMGLPIDRDNHNVRLAMMAECLTNARNADPGAGLALMDNKYWRFAVAALLEARDRARLHQEDGRDLP
jgi:hypothetical protein